MRLRFGLTMFAVLVLLAASEQWYLCISGSAADLQSENESVHVVKFQPGGRIYLPVAINGTKRQLFLNTTVPDTILDFALRDVMREVDTNDRKTDGPKTLEFLASPQVLIGEHRADVLELGKTIRFNNFALNETVRDIGGDGAIGMDYLKTKILKIDFDNNIAQIRQTSDFTDCVTEPMKWVGGVPMFLIRHPNEGFLSCRIMLGDTNIALQADLYNRLVKKGRIKELPGEDPSGKVFRHHGILDSIEFGPYRFCNQYVELNTASVVGQQFLSRFNIEFDFPQSKARIKPSTKIDAPSWYNRVGFVYRYWSNRRFVVVFDGGGPASVAGLRDDDELLEINGIRSQEITDPELWRMLSVPGSIQHLTIRRGENTKSIEFESSDEPAPFPKLPLQTEAAADLDFIEEK